MKTYINALFLGFTIISLFFQVSISVTAQSVRDIRNTNSSEFHNEITEIPDNFNRLTDPGITDIDTNLFTMCLPFNENWNGGSFEFFKWTFTPSQGSWVINYVNGYPPPSAGFQGASASVPENYSYALVSLPLLAEPWTCDDIFLSFDIQLIDRLMTNTEKMSVEVLYDNVWHHVTEYSNSGSFGWRNDIFLLSGADGHRIQIRFTAHGSNKYNFQEWLIDNILVQGICPPPENLQGSVSSGCVTLTWSSPCPQQKTVYDIYRSNHYGNPPYVKLNSDEITDTVFSYTPAWGLSYIYKYYVIALQIDTLSGLEFCASESSDTVLVSFPVGMAQSEKDKVSLFPVPASDNIVITSEMMITDLCLTDHLGKIQYEATGINLNRVEVNVTGWNQGVYFARITAAGLKKVMKFIIQKE